MDLRPIVTYAGDQAVFAAIEPGLVGGLPTESIEWKRSYGRPSKLTCIECSFAPFDAELIERRGSRLEGQPVFHTFWTDVTDLDTYKQGLREEILAWQNSIKKTGVASDWMVVVVEAPDSKKVNKFPLRTTVLEKLKQEVGGKTPDRCVTLIDPGKSGEGKAAESMQALLHKFRTCFLQSFNKVLNRFEEQIRSQREKRTENRWNFCQYFLLQEELAFVYEMMGLHEESLIQYDELDALFTQFVLNCAVGEVPGWLAAFEKTPVDWGGPSLDKNLNMRLQARLATLSPSLLDIRNYLFSRQSCLLLVCGKPWEVARRALSFVHNTLQELDILETERGLSGSLDCWVLLTCLEVLQACARHTEPGQGQQHCLFTADLWAYATRKLLNLGSLCGLLPGQKPNSEQLHLMVSLTSGMQEDMYLTTGNERNPLERLKESLSSNEAFTKNYLEMCETAISSYKHIGRIRSARLVGKELASFYMDLGEVGKAASFLADGLKTFQQEKWSTLAGKTMLELANLNEKEKYVKIAAQIAGSEGTEFDERLHFHDQMISTLATIHTKGELTQLHAEDVLDFVSCTLEKEGPEEQVVPGKQLTFLLVINSRLPRALTCSTIQVSFVKEEVEEVVVPEKRAGKRGQGLQRSPSGASNSLSTVSQKEEVDEEGEELEEGRLDIVEQLDYKQDKSLCAARLVCRNPGKVLRRKDSSGSILKEGQITKADYSGGPIKEDEDFQPGTNTYRLSCTAGGEGKYQLTQLSVTTKHLDLLCAIPITSSSTFTVTSVKPAVALNRASQDSELYAGLENKMVVSVHTGSCGVDEGTLLALSCSRGLTVRMENSSTTGSQQLMMPLPAGKPFTNISVKVVVLAALVNQKDSTTIEHKVSIRDPWSSKETEIFVHFIPAFYTTFQLQTAMAKKFLQVFLFPLAETRFHLRDQKLILQEPSPAGLSFTPLNSDQELVAAPQCEAGYLWQMKLEGEEEKESGKQVRGNFCLQYAADLSPDSSLKEYQAAFHLQDFLTLYTVQAKVEPARGNEFCRAGTMCPLTVILEQCNSTTFTSLYYEVIADQATWAVCGRQGAVVTVEEKQLRQTIVIDVMPLVGGHLPLPAIRLSKYIPADSKQGLGGARLDPFATGQVYNMSRSQQIHVLPPLNQHNEFVSLP